MRLCHLGLTSSNEQNADRFYGGLLGLEKKEPKSLPAALSQALFGIDSELTVLNYTGETVHFELFVGGVGPILAPSAAHACLEVTGLEGFLERCRALGVPVRRVPKTPDAWITFIQDFDGNLFEIKG
jgi:catechol 2,3-dioxygenase-like lactoylglutathione lyase family enzyme